MGRGSVGVLAWALAAVGIAIGVLGGAAAGAAQADSYCVQNGALPSIPCPASFAGDHVFQSFGAVLPGLHDGDSVQIEPGTYDESNAFGGRTGVTFFGDPTETRRPVLTTASSVSPTFWINQMADGTTVRHLEIDQTGVSGEAAFRTGDSISNDHDSSVNLDDVAISALSGTGIDAQQSSLTVRHATVTGGGDAIVGQAGSVDVSNSLVIATGSAGSGIAVLGGSGTVRNATVIAPGNNAFGIDADDYAPAAIASTVIVENSVVRAGSDDLFATAGGPSGCGPPMSPQNCPPSTLIATRDDYQPQTGAGVTVPAGAGNISSDPLFVNGTLGAGQDFHVRRGSPLIDAGVTVPPGDVDLDGAARPQGAAPDLGAYESDYPPLAPSISITAPAGGASYPQHAARDASFACAAAAGTTVRSCSGPVANGAAIDTSSLGTHTFTVTAVDADAGAASKTVPYTVTSSEPVVRALRQSTKRWRRSNAHHARRHKLPVGTTFTFTLNEPASVTFAFARPGAGRAVNGTCVKPSRHNRRKPRCALAAGRLTVQGTSGANSVVFKGKKLRPGVYIAKVTATAGGQTTPPQTLRFTVVQ